MGAHRSAYLQRPGERVLLVGCLLEGPSLRVAAPCGTTPGQQPAPVNLGIYR